MSITIVPFNACSGLPPVQAPLHLRKTNEWIGLVGFSKAFGAFCKACLQDRCMHIINYAVMSRVVFQASPEELVFIKMYLNTARRDFAKRMRIQRNNIACLCLFQGSPEDSTCDYSRRRLKIPYACAKTCRFVSPLRLRLIWPLHTPPVNAPGNAPRCM